jgi:hypothetical protein
MFQAYKDAILNTTLAGPTHFGRVLSAILQYMQTKTDSKMYHILLILTDGIIHDMP